jgi:hypothetical protein
VETSEDKFILKRTNVEFQKTVTSQMNCQK